MCPSKGRGRQACTLPSLERGRPRSQHQLSGTAACAGVASHIEANLSGSYKRSMLSNQKFLLVPASALLALIASCHPQPPPGRVAQTETPPPPSPEPTILNTPGRSVADCIKQIPFLEAGERSGMLRAWKKYPGYQNYRMVEAPDFRIPEWVSHEYYASDAARATGWSHDYGELSGAYGLVLFMVDKTLPYPNRFSIAVLIRRPANRFDLYWIFQGADLTHFTMGRHSGNVYFSEYADDRKTRACDIQYSRKQNRWACEFYN